MDTQTNTSLMSKTNSTVFFLGAGASVAANVPTTIQFVTQFKDWISIESTDDNKQVLSKVLSVLSRNGRQVDIELLMESLDSLTGSLGTVQDLFKYSEEIADIQPECFALLKKELKSFIQRSTLVKAEKIGYLEPLLSFMDAGVLEIFSANYDTCIEQLCHLHRKKYTDGFEFEWWPRAFERDDLELKLYKIHGSVLWYETQESKYLKIPIPPRGPLEIFSGGLAEPLMLYPMRKWQYAEPLLELMVLLKRRLENQQATKYVVVAGYSFRDLYIKQLFWDAFRSNKDLVMVLVDPNAVEIYKNELKYYATSGGAGDTSKIASSMFDRVVCLPYKFEEALPRLKGTFLPSLQEGRSKYAAALSVDRSDGNANWQNPLQPLLLAGDYELFKAAYPKAKWRDIEFKEKINILGTAIIVAASKGVSDDARSYAHELANLCIPIMKSAGWTQMNRQINKQGIKLGIAFTFNRSAYDSYQFANVFRQIGLQTKHITIGHKEAEEIAAYFDALAEHFVLIENMIPLDQYANVYQSKVALMDRVKGYIEKLKTPEILADKNKSEHLQTLCLDVEKVYLVSLISDIEALVSN